MNRQETAEVFRARLNEVVEASGLSRSAFAGKVGMDRSTLSQLFSADNERLPRAETIVAIANIAQVSVDWLLGISQEGSLSADMMMQGLDLEESASSPADKRLLNWHAEAVGYKIRYVPTTLPDLLKSEEVIRFEYGKYGDRRSDVSEGRIEQAGARLNYSRRPETDMEVCSSRQALTGFAHGEGIWENLDKDIRIAQLDSMIGLVDELYPTFRWFLYDGRQHFSAPVTIFGPQRAAVYLGNMFLVMNSTKHIRVLTNHFDNLIRAAIFQPTEVVSLLEKLKSELSGKKKRNKAQGASD